MPERYSCGVQLGTFVSLLVIMLVLSTPDPQWQLVIESTPVAQWANYGSYVLARILLAVTLRILIKKISGGGILTDVIIMYFQLKLRILLLHNAFYALHIFFLFFLNSQFLILPSKNFAQY